MRAVFVNFSHPDTPHVSGLRVPTFARELAKRGHEIVLVTLPKEGVPAPASPLAERLRAHDWRTPFHLTWPLRPSPLLVRMLAGKLPAWRRKPLTAWWYLTRGGVRWDWTMAGLPAIAELNWHWQADVVWGSFGQLDVVQLTQQIAMQMNCPGVWTSRIIGPYMCRRGCVGGLPGDSTRLPIFLSTPDFI